MKRKLLVTLVASALELYVGSATAQAVNTSTCPIPANADKYNGASPFSTGPADPTTYFDLATNGGVSFPTYVADGTLALQRCVENATGYCALAGLPDPAIPLSVQSQAAEESFYHVAVSSLTDASGGTLLTVEFAFEASFLGGFVDGNQVTFTRMRVRGELPAEGKYTLTHPYGQTYITADVSNATVNNNGATVYTVNATSDVFFTPNQLQATGVAGPFLKWATYGNRAAAVYDPANPLSTQQPPLGYIGDGITPAPVVGSPCGTNYIGLTGVGTDGSAINVDGAGNDGSTDVRSTEFVIVGQVTNGVPLTPADVRRVTYGRSAVADRNDVGINQIDAFVQSAGTDRAVTLLADEAGFIGTNRALAGNANAQFFGSEVLVDQLNNPESMPLIVALKADTTAGAAAPATAVTLYRQPIDQVTISSATYDTGTKALTVKAESSDKRVPPKLTVYETQTPADGVAVPVDVPPYTVTVLSSAGGKETVKVVVDNAVLPAAPTDLQAKTPTAFDLVELSWTDKSTNETNFDIYRFVGTGAPAVVGTRGANNGQVSPFATYPDTPTIEFTTYSYFVKARNGAGSSAASNTVTATTPGRPIALPFNLRQGGTTPTSNTIQIQWNDGAVTGRFANETAYRITRTNNTTNTATVLLPLLAANATVFNDNGLTPSTSYTYKVEAVRSVAGQAEYSVAATTGATAGAGNASITISTTAGRSLVAATNLAVNSVGTPATNPAVRPSLNFVDASVDETGYQITRQAVSVGTTGVAAAPSAVTTATTQIRTTAQLQPTGVSGQNRRYTDGMGTAPVAGTIYQYNVMAIDTVPNPDVLAADSEVRSISLVYGGMPTVAFGNNPTAGNSTANATLLNPARQGTINVTWTAAAETAVSGYEVYVCTGAAANCTASVGTWVLAGTVSGRGTTSLRHGANLASPFAGRGSLTSGTRYNYKIRAISPSAYGFTGAYSAIRGTNSN